MDSNDPNKTWKILHDSKLISTSEKPYKKWIDSEHESWMDCECLTARKIREKEMEIIKNTNGDRLSLEKEEMINEMNAALNLDGSNIMEILNLLFCSGHEKTIDELTDEEILERSYLVQKAILLISIHAAEFNRVKVIRRAKRGPKEFENLEANYKPRARKIETGTAGAHKETPLEKLAKQFGLTPKELAEKIMGSPAEKKE